MKKLMLSPLFLVLVSTLANAQTFVWQQTGSGMSHTTVSTYALNAAAFSQLNTANPGTGDYVWAKNLGGWQYTTIGQRVRFRLNMSSTAQNDHFVAALNYSPINGWYGSNYGVIDNVGMAVIVGSFGCGANMIALEAIGGTAPNVVNCTPMPSTNVIIEFEVNNQGYVNAWVYNSTGTQLLTWLGASLSSNYPGGVPLHTGIGFASVTPEFTPQGYTVIAELLSHEYLYPENPCAPYPHCP